MQSGPWGGGQNNPPTGPTGGYPGYPPQQPGYPSQALQPAPADGITRAQCQLCGRHAPVKQVSFMQNIGMLVIRFPKSIKGWLCKRCISSCFWRMTTITFFLGWWGIISFFYSLVSIPMNIINYLGALSLPDQ